jgi:hypothetical protein
VHDQSELGLVFDKENGGFETRKGQPELTWRARLYRELLQWSRILAHFAFVGAALYAAAQWYGAKVDGQVKQVLTLYDKYNSTPLIQYRKDLDALIANNNDAFNTAMHEKKQDDYVKLIVRLMTTSDAANGFDLISDFFDGLSVCVSASLCDEDVAVRLFHPRALELFDVYAPYIGYVRGQNGVKDFAAGIIEFAGRVPRKRGFLGNLHDSLF